MSVDSQKFCCFFKSQLNQIFLGRDAHAFFEKVRQVAAVDIQAISYLPDRDAIKNVDGHQLKTTLISSDDTITINNGISNDNAQSLLSGVFQNNVDDEDESFVDGQNNTGYKQLVKMFDGFQDDDGVRSYNAKVNVNSVTPISDKKFKVNYQVKFTFDNQNNDGDDSSTKKIQVFKYTGTIVKTNDQNSNNGLKIKDLGHAKKVSESNEHED